MSMSKVKSVVGLSLLLLNVALASDAVQLGERVNATELANVDLTILIDGDGLPPGSGDAIKGASLYLQNCLACHGAGGEDGLNDRLVGGHGSLTTSRPVKTIGSYWPYATTLFDYVRRAMPYQSPGSLNDEDVYSIVAYLLFLNDVVAEDAVLDATSLPQVKMPNRDNFVWAYVPQATE